MQRQVLDLLEGWLRHKSDMVNFEAARAICEMKNVPQTQLSKAISGALHMLDKITILTQSSIAIVFVVSQASLEIRRDANSCSSCPVTPYQRCYLQC